MVGDHDWVFERQDDQWKALAACEDKPQEWFYQDTVQGRYELGRAVCERCPVMSDCLEYALAYNDVHGLWGGMSPRERQREKRRRGDGSPASPVRRAPRRHGDEAGYKQHLRRGEEACEECRVGMARDKYARVQANKLKENA